MTVVMDASAVFDLLVGASLGARVRHFIETERPHLASVAHLDAEVLGGLARSQRAGDLSPDEVEAHLHRLGSIAMPRLPINRSLLTAAWSLRQNVAARDALYVATARALQARLLTTDDRLARAVPDLAVSLG